MLSTRQLGRVFLLLILLATALYAQTTTPPSDQEPAAKTSIIIERQLVRFITQGEAQVWQLVVTNQQAEVVFDSGSVYGVAVEWPLKNQQDEPLLSGLYAYTLSTKAVTDETARTQRGYLIVDRASSNDRVWVASTQPVGIGAGSATPQVTVVGSHAATVGGAELPAAAPSREASGERSELPKRADAEAAAEKAAAPAIVTGTANQLAKFAADGSTLVDSTVNETASGDIGIGTTAPGGVLDLQRASSGDILQRFWNTGTGGAKLRYVTNTGQTAQVQLTDLNEWLSAIAGNNNGLQFRVRAPGTPNTEAQLNASARMTILRNGNVGIGTSSPLGELHIAGFGPAITLESRQNGINRLTYIQNADGTLVFKPEGFGFCCAAMVMQANTGNVGIGVNNPAAKLSVAAPTASSGNNTAAFEAPGIGPNASNIHYGTTGDWYIRSAAAAGKVILQDTGGNVGIGVSNPTTAKLQVAAPGTAIVGTSTTSNLAAIYGENLSSGSSGVTGKGGSGGYGVYGEGGKGVYGKAIGSGGDAIHGEAIGGDPNSHAGWFDGRVVVFHDLEVFGNKDFVEPHPTDPNKMIKYVALEGPESGTYFRGSGRIVNGVATIQVPEDFRLTTDEKGLTIQVTPMGEPATIWCVKKSLDQIELKGSADVEFDYLVNGVRRLSKDHQPIVENTLFVPRSADDNPFKNLKPAAQRRLKDTGILNEDGTVNMETVKKLDAYKRRFKQEQ